MILKRQVKDIQFVLPLADTLERSYVSAIMDAYDVKVRIVEGEIYDVVAVSDAAIVASGTATLETALLETPMLIIYKISPLSYLLGRLFIHVSHIGLVNIIAGKSVVPEFIQADAEPERLAKALLEILTDERRMAAIRLDLSNIKKKLGEPGATQRAAALAYGML